MSETKQFHIGDILSITTGSLVSPRHMDGIYDILGHMTGESLMTHQLPRAMDESEDSLRAQFPDLASIEVPDWSAVPEESRKAAISAWLDDLAESLGATREVRALAAEDHTSIDPIAEIKMMRPDMPIVTFTAPQD